MKTIFLSVAMVLLISVAAKAESIDFYNVTGNDPDDAAIGEAQLSVEVTDLGEGQVAFTFNNSGPEPCSIAGVYFDDGRPLILEFVTAIPSGPGVAFSQDASPSNLPGWDTVVPVFQTTDGLSADSDPPAQPLGVNPGESLTIVLVLQGDSTFADVLEDLASGKLRIGLHVQGYASEGSESFVNNCCSGIEGCCDAPTCFDGIDNDGDGLVDWDDPTCREWCSNAPCGVGGLGCMGQAEASVYGTDSTKRPAWLGQLAVLLIPVGYIFLLKRSRRKK